MPLGEHWRNWHTRATRKRIERLAVLIPITRVTAYADPDTIPPGNRTRQEWLELVAFVRARRDAAVSLYGPDPFGLRSAQYNNQTEDMLH